MSETAAAAAEPSAEQKPEDSKPKTIADVIAKRRDAFANVATQYLDADRLIRLAQLIVAKNPRLGQSTPLSIIDSLMLCAQLGLKPGEPGGVWLVPYRVSIRKPNGEWTKQMVCQPIIDYRGLLDVCRRSGDIAGVHADVRYENDQWEFYIDTASPTLVHLKHIKAEKERGKIVGAYFVARLKSGECQARYLTVEEIEEYRSRSKNAKGEDSPWVKDWPAMAIKTAVRRGVNLLPRTPEVTVIQEALHKEDMLDLDASQYSVEDDRPAIPLPKRLGEGSPSPSPSPSQSQPDEDAGSDADEYVMLKSVKVIAGGPRNGQADVAIEGSEAAYKCKDVAVIDHMVDAWKQKRRVALEVEKGGWIVNAYVEE